MRAGVLALVCGCSFHGSATALLDATGDSTNPIDGSPDAPPDAAGRLCAIPGTTAPMPTSMVLGGGGGSAAPDFTCPMGQLPVGFAFDVTTGVPPGGWSEVAITGIHVRCAVLSAFANGVITTTMGIVDRVASPCGASGAKNWNTTAITEQDCPAGNVLVGMTGNADTNNGTQSMFNNVAMVCAPLVAASPIGTGVSIAFAGTGSSTDHRETATCAANTAIVNFGSRAACGQDQLAPRCAAIACN